MKFYVGQRVSLLHETGEGKVTSIIDKETVEVDFGDDFPLDVHVDEIIPIGADEGKFFGRKEEENEEKIGPGKLGGNLFSLSLAVTPEEEGEYRFTLINPESHAALYTFFSRIKHKYQALAHGKVPGGGKEKLCYLSKDTMREIRSLYFQVIFYKEGKGFPQAPLACEISWDKNKLQGGARLIEAMGKDGWLYDLRKIAQSKDGGVEGDGEYVKVKKISPKIRPVMVTDLHIEKLVTKPHLLEPSLLLGIQLDHLERSLSDALLENVERLILIHGIGTGKLRNAIRKKLQDMEQVKSFGPADPGAYGNGATEVVLR